MTCSYRSPGAAARAAQEILAPKHAKIRGMGFKVARVPGKCSTTGCYFPMGPGRVAEVTCLADSAPIMERLAQAGSSSPEMLPRVWGAFILSRDPEWFIYLREDLVNVPGPVWGIAEMREIRDAVSAMLDRHNQNALDRLNGLRRARNASVARNAEVAVQLTSWVRHSGLWLDQATNRGSWGWRPGGKLILGGEADGTLVLRHPRVR